MKKWWIGVLCFFALFAAACYAKQNTDHTVQDPHDTELREPGDIHVTVLQDENGQYQVSIPEIPQSEVKINAWLQAFYEEDADARNDFMGIGIEDSDVYLSEQERLAEGFSYKTSFWVDRADDAIISFQGQTSTYSGGAHGNDHAFSVNFDTRSGNILSLPDILSNAEEFYIFSMEYIAGNYSEYGWGEEYVEEALMGDGWCVSGCGIRIFLNGGNGLGLYEYEIPYECLVDYIKPEYLPTSGAAGSVYHESFYQDGLQLYIHSGEWESEG